MYRIRATYLPRAGMQFDLEYYFRVHVPLARQTTAGRLNIRSMEVESNAVLLTDATAKRAPCVLSLSFDSMEDVDAFRRLLLSQDVDALRADVSRYTNCDLEWTLSSVQEV
ncbi:MAG: hypothetical protein A3H91_15265 [Gammaproteobacteria bacterium RIFCSPLOWO2_02_FULL_61_13]|nr:MAG: hypothetical protein A3H91_15265 [Gammaproteobacteria bacterium RIFCSPLOWO2_02_FULL_61_13]